MVTGYQRADTHDVAPTVQQSAFILKQVDDGMSVEDACRAEMLVELLGNSCLERGNSSMLKAGGARVMLSVRAAACRVSHSVH
jgi:hypothetical protein